MHVSHLSIRGFRGIRSGNLTLAPHVVLIGPNNCGKTSVIEAMALLLGRDRLVRSLTEHDFFGSAPQAATRISLVATITGFPQNDPKHSPQWFGMDYGVEKWMSARSGRLAAVADAEHTMLAVQIGLCARFDLEDLEAEVLRFFVDDDSTTGDPFADNTFVRPVPQRLLQELGFFLVPASRTWDRWVSFTSDLFRRVISARGEMPARAVHDERQRLWQPAEPQRLEGQPGLVDIATAVDEELAMLLPDKPSLKFRLTSTDSRSVLDSIVPHFQRGAGPVLPTARHGTGLVSIQSLLLLMQFGKARAETERSFVLAVEEPELHVPPSQQKRLVNRLNALCDQTIMTTHSPVIAAMFPVDSTIFLTTVDGELVARPLVDQAPAAPTNHQQHLFYAWRENLIGALMHECVLVPEGASDVAWLEALQTALELRQQWSAESETPSHFSTFIGVIPTVDAKIIETLTLVSNIHANSAALLDGDAEGSNYLDAITRAAGVCSTVLMWPDGWHIEHVLGWIASGEAPVSLPLLRASLGQPFESLNAFVDYIHSQKSYAPTHEATAVALMSVRACRERAACLLNAASDVLRDSSSSTSTAFVRVPERSSLSLKVFRFVP